MAGGEPSSDERVFVIGEAGVNHDGQLERALELVDAAAMSGADAVKFQTFKPGECTGRFAFMTDYQVVGAEPDESRYEMSARLALPYEDFRKIRERCRERGIMFLSTPDGFDSLEFLVEELGIPIIKVGSTEVTHIPYLEAIGAKGHPVFFSTGLSTLSEVEIGVQALRRHGDPEITLLQCTSEYPASDDEVNVRAMVTMGNALGLPVGLSDHSLGYEAGIAAVALGATVIEKHFTLDSGLPGPDHKASMEPDALRDFVTSIHRTKVMLGDGLKRPQPSEVRNKDSIRRSIVAARPLEAGVVLEREMLGFKRPGYGVPPGDVEAVVGMRLNTALREDEVIQWKHLK